MNNTNNDKSFQEQQRIENENEDNTFNVHGFPSISISIDVPNHLKGDEEGTIDYITDHLSQLPQSGPCRYDYTYGMVRDMVREYLEEDNS